MRIALVLLLLSTSVFGQVYTIGPTDNLTQACAALKAGDELVLKSGRYSSYCEIRAIGTKTNPVLVRSEDFKNPATCTRTGGGCFYLIQASWVTLKNLGCDGSPGSCVKLSGSQFNTVINLRAKNCFEGVTITEGSNGNEVRSSFFEGNTHGIYNMYRSNGTRIINNTFNENSHGPKGDRCTICFGGNKDNPSGDDGRVEGNTLTRNGGYESDAAIAVGFGKRHRVTKNRIFDNYRGGLLLGECEDCIADNNEISGNGRSCETETNIFALRIANMSHRSLAMNNTLRDNCVAPNNRWGEIGPRGALDVRSPNPMDNVKLIDNTVSGTKNGPDIYIEPKSDVKGLLLQ